MFERKRILSYRDFLESLEEAGFSTGGGNSEGIFALIPWGWQEEPPYETPVRWHTGNRETDPWEWRIRVLQEGRGIAYGKVFFNKSGYITRKWYPYFLAARRGTDSLEEKYRDGEISNAAKRIYQAVQDNGSLPLHLIKELSGFGREEKSSFDRALTQLQMKLYLTMCGSQRKTNRLGEEYGWSSTVFSTVEEFWGPEIMEEASEISPQEAYGRIEEQIYVLNPQANPRKIKKFIVG